MIQGSRTNGSENPHSGEGFQDTITLLHEEIGRLEEELRLRDQALVESHGAPAPTEPATAAPHAAEQTIADLATELSRRDETIALLFDQIRDLEEAEIASRQEWEQLENWVREVEQRVDTRDQEAESLHRQREAVEKARADRHALETERRALEAERQGWELQRREFQVEIDRLRNRAELASRQSTAAGPAPQGALEQENRRLRAAYEEVVAQTANEIGPIRAEAVSFRAEADSLRVRLADVEFELDRTRDELLRQQNEHQAALASLRSELALEALHQRKEGSVSFPNPAAAGAPAANQATDPAGPLSTDDRMWAFRSHLQDVYKQELEERKNRRLSTRLSRLWSRTAPER